MREALKLAVEICKTFEGFISEPYNCPAGVPTIGYGSTYYLDGTRVTLQDKPITQSQAELILIKVLLIYIQDVLKASPTLVNNEPVLGAITSFCYNLGVSRYRASTLRKRIDSQNWAESRIEIMKWTRCNGKILSGLVKRRAVEAKLI